MNEFGHCSTILCATPAAAAFRVMADPFELGRWALGCWETKLVAEDTVEGTSLFDGQSTRVRVKGDEEHLSVDFDVANAAGIFQPRIQGRVLPGDALDRQADSCVVTLIAWRTAGMTDDRWQQLVKSHEAEIFLLKARIELVHAGR